MEEPRVENAAFLMGSKWFSNTHTHTMFAAWVKQGYQWLLLTAEARQCLLRGIYQTPLGFRLARGLSVMMAVLANCIRGKGPMEPNSLPKGRGEHRSIRTWPLKRCNSYEVWGCESKSFNRICTCQQNLGCPRVTLFFTNMKSLTNASLCYPFFINAIP